VTRRVVVVVGATSGIGLAAALRFARGGDALILIARSEQSLQRTRAAVLHAGASDVLFHAGDVRNGDDMRAVIHAAITRHGRIDVLVQTATTMAYGRVEDLPADVFDAVTESAIRGTANLARAALPIFRRQGQGVFVIVNSLLGSVTAPTMRAYATAKWGQRAIARTLQQELRDSPGVKVCLIDPGSVNTPIYYQAANHVGRRARPPFPVSQPDRVAAAIVGVVERPRRNVSARVGPTNPLIIAGFRLLPMIYDAMVTPLFQLGALLREPVAPTPGNVLKPQPVLERVHGHWPDRAESD